MRNEENKGNHSYTCYGLKIRSCFVFPELKEEKFEKADVIVAEGQVMKKYLKENLSPGIYFESYNCFIFKLEEGTLIQVENGNSIIVQRACRDWAEEALIRLYLASTIFNSILHQRGVLLLHASVVIKKTNCIAVAGQSGDGKSTTAAELCLNKQYSLIADDTCAIFFGENKQYRIMPSISRIKILPAAIKILDLKDWKISKIDGNSEKSAISISEMAKINIENLTTVYILKINNNKKLFLNKLRGIEKIEALLKNTFWINYLRWMGNADKIFQYCSFLARDTDVYYLNFDKNYHHPSRLAAVIEGKTCETNYNQFVDTSA